MSETRSVVDEFYRRLGTGAVDDVADLFADHIAFHLTVEGGKITRYVTFEDSLALARAFQAD